MADRKSRTAARNGIARMRDITREVSKLNGRIHSGSSEKASSNGTSGKASKPASGKT